MLDMIMAGFSALLDIDVIILIFIGTIVGIIFGSIPGLSATMAVALCLPLTFGMTPTNAIAILLSLYIGGISGGLISAILLNIPGTPSSIATTFDGSPMALRGEAGKALGIGILYSFIGGFLSILALIFISPLLAQITLKFGPIEYFSVSIFSLTMIASLSQGSLFRGIISGFLGMAFAMIGSAPIDGLSRFTFGIHDLDAGFALIPVLIGMFAVPEILKAAKSDLNSKENTTQQNFKMKGFGISKVEFIKQIPNLIRSTLIGTGIGILPGVGGGTSNLIAYTAAKNSSKYPEKFGTGIIDGIVASESSNNATVGGALVPLLTLGIPGDAVTAILLGGLMIHGMTPGPLLFKTNGEFMYTIFAILILANFVMLFVEFLGLRVFVKILSINKAILLPIIMVLCIVGAFGSNNRIFDSIALVFFGIVGYVLEKYKFPLTPVILGFILAPLIEINLRRGLMLTEGNFFAFFASPIAVVFLSIAALSIFASLRKEMKVKKLNNNK